MDYFGQIIQRYPGENLFWVHASVPAGTLNMGRYATRRQLETAHRPAVDAVATWLDNVVVADTIGRAITAFLDASVVADRRVVRQARSPLSILFAVAAMSVTPEHDALVHPDDCDAEPVPTDS